MVMEVTLLITNVKRFYLKVLFKSQYLIYLKYLYEFIFPSRLHNIQKYNKCFHQLIHRCCQTILYSLVCHKITK